MAVSQSDIASGAGVDRTTVNKILNRRPDYQANKHTVEKVLKAAEELGYDISRLRRNSDKRKDERKKINLRVDVTLLLKDGTVHDSGTARIRNLSLSGALLGELQTNTNLIPVQPFTARLTIQQGSLKGVILEGEFIRFESNGHVDFGIRFEKLSRKVRQTLKSLIAINKQEEDK